MSKSSIRQSLFFQMGYEMLILILPIITSPYIARVIGAEGLGTYSYTSTVANYFVLFAMLGIKNYGNRVIAQAQDNAEKLNSAFSSLLVIHVGVSVLCVAAYLGYTVLLKDDRFYALIQSTVVLSALFDISWFYFGIEKFKLTVAISTAIKLLTVLCIFLLVRQRDDLWKYCMIMSMGILFNQLALWYPLKKYVRFVRPSVHSVLSHLKPLLILFIPAIAVSLYKYMDKIMIGAISGKVQLGYYENAEKVINISLSVIGALGTVMLPRMSNLMQSSKRDAVLRYITVSMRYIMILSFAIAFGLAGVGQVFAPLFWGEEFTPSGMIIIGLAATIPFWSFANVIRTQYLIPAERDKDYLYSVMLGAVVNLAINYALIPKFGSMGATVGTIAAEVSVCAFQGWVVRKELEIKKYINNALPFFIAGTVMFLIVYAFGQKANTSLTTLILQILLGAGVYVTICVSYLYLIRESVLMGALQRLREGRAKDV